MPDENSDLPGNAPDRSGAALLIIDMINDMEFEGGDEMLAHAMPAARAVSMRGYALHVPRDCVATRQAHEAEHVLEVIRCVLKADTRPSHELALDALLRAD
jgi:hypothetical protein